jgi:hypothetical protein
MIASAAPARVRHRAACSPAAGPALSEPFWLSQKSRTTTWGLKPAPSRADSARLSLASTASTREGESSTRSPKRQTLARRCLSSVAPLRPSSRSARGSIFYWGPGGLRTTGAGDSPGEIVGARAPLALVLAKSEDFDRGGSAARRRSLRLLSPRRDAPRMAGQSPNLTRATRRPLLILRPVHRVRPA